MDQIDEKTKISLFAVLVSLPVLAGAVLWLSSVDALAKANKEKIEEIRPLVKETRDAVIRIEERLKGKK